MKMIIKQYSWAFFLMIFTAGCTLDNISGSTNSTITEEDIQAASQILGESLSSDNSGVFLSLNDALTNISSSSFSSPAPTTGTVSYPIQTDRSGIGNESNYQYSYDAQTGIHSISFERNVQRSLFEKSVSDTLNYIFEDENRNFIEFPREQQDRIETITYNGRRQGQLSTLRKESFFVRKDTFLISGVSNTSRMLNIDGVHKGEGTTIIQPASGNTIERSYELEINFLNIELQRLSTGGINIDRGVSGTLSWQMLIEKTEGERSDSNTIRGTVELSGDGTALLRFQSLLKLFQINLNDGDVKDQEEEFEGRVQAVSEPQQSITLVNGRIIYFNSETDFDSEEYPDVNAVQRALSNGISLWAEGDGSIENGEFIAEEVEFETEGEDDDDGDDGNEGEDEIEFEEQLTAVNLDTRTFTLGNQVIVQINDQTTISQSGDYQSLQEVADALDQGTTIEADGEAIETDDPSIDLIALEVQFDADEDYDDDED